MTKTISIIILFFPEFLIIANYFTNFVINKIGMKKTIISLILFLNINQIALEKNFIYVDYDALKFNKAYEHIRKWEGNYSYLEFDSGGETYGGITRNYNPNWSGWKIIDELKKDTTLSWNHHIPQLEAHVKNYYFEKWQTEKYNQIREPLIASYLFDYSNTGIIAIKHLKEILLANGYCVPKGLKLDDYTISVINKMNAVYLIDNLKKIRKEYYYNVTLRKPELVIYLKGWLNRAESIIS